MQYPKSRNHLKNVEKTMNFNQMKQLFMWGLQCKCCVVSHYTCSDLFHHWNLRFREFVKPFVYFYSFIFSKSNILLNIQLLADLSLSSDVTKKSSLQISHQIVCVKNNHSSCFALGMWERREWFLLFSSCGFLDSADR